MSVRPRPRSAEGMIWQEDMAESWIDTRPGLAEGRFRTGEGRSWREPRQQNGHGEGLANVLGWFSIGLGMAELIAPDSVARLVGVEPDDRTRTIVRGLGAREVLSGIGILATSRPTNWVRARVAGDAMDAALLTRLLRSRSTDSERTSASLAAVLAVGVIDAYCAQQLMTDGRRSMTRTRMPMRAGARARDRGVEVHQSVTVNREPSEVYEFWHDFENLPRFMRHLESVDTTGPGRTHWKAKALAGQTVEWDAEITEDRPNERIAWRSIDGGMVENEGVVEFCRAPGNRGTEVHVHLRYEPPGGRMSAALAKLFHREPGQQIEEDLRAFKQVLETGEVTVSDATITAGPHPAMPPTREELRDRVR